MLNALGTAYYVEVSKIYVGFGETLTLTQLIKEKNLVLQVFEF